MLSKGCTLFHGQWQYKFSYKDELLLGTRQICDQLISRSPSWYNISLICRYERRRELGYSTQVAGMLRSAMKESFEMHD